VVEVVEPLERMMAVVMTWDLVAVVLVEEEVALIQAQLLTVDRSLMVAALMVMVLMATEQTQVLDMAVVLEEEAVVLTLMTVLTVVAVDAELTLLVVAIE
tara:strand:+ start:162 stop:461 length:300 start_codon:yes stop_codon:yes gene_type:complete